MCGSYLALPNKTIISKVLKHRFLRLTQILCRVFLNPKVGDVNLAMSIMITCPSKPHGRQHEQEAKDLHDIHAPLL